MFRFLSLGIFLLSLASSAKEFELVVAEALKNHPAMSMKEFEAQAENERSAGFELLDDPMLGWMKEGEATSWILTQNMKFPLKYFKAGDLQQARIKKAEGVLDEARWDYRKQIISAYYRYELSSQNLLLLETQKKNLADVVRSVASKRASGGLRQQEELRLSLEQTKLETEILLETQNLTEAKAQLESLVGTAAIASSSFELKRPILKKEWSLDLLGDQGPRVLTALNSYELARVEREQTRLDSFPDFKLSYKAPLNSYTSERSIGVEFSIPLWFFGKQSSATAASEAALMAAQRAWELSLRERKEAVTGLFAKVQNREKLLSLYEISLLPQAKSALQSSLNSYQTGSGRFIDVIDSQSFYYDQKRAYHDNLLAYVEALLELEKTTGKILANFPQGALE